MMYRVYLVNFGFYLQDSFSSIVAARKAGSVSGFQFAIFTDKGELA